MSEDIWSPQCGKGCRWNLAGGDRDAAKHFTGPSPNRVSSTSASSRETCGVHLTVSFSDIKLLSDFSVRVETRFLVPPWPASCFNMLMLFQLVTFSLSVPPYSILHMQKCFFVSLTVPGAKWVLLLLLLHCYFLVRFTVFQSKMSIHRHLPLPSVSAISLSEDLTCVIIGCSFCMPPRHIKSSMDVRSWCCSTLSLCLWQMQESCLHEWSEQTLVLDCGFQSISSTNWRSWDCYPGSQVKISHVG